MTAGADWIGPGAAAALFSAFTQAVAHALLKAGRDKLMVRGLIAATCAVTVAPLALVVAPPTGWLWGWLALSSFLHVVYQLVLIRAYETDDFSVAYPLARGVAPVATTILGVLWLGQRLPPLSVLGVLVVTLGLLTIAFRGGASRIASLAAIAAGLLTAVYTVVDGHAVRLAPQASTFIVWFFLAEGAAMVPLTIVRRWGRLKVLAREGAKNGVLAGLTSLAGYASALVALRLLPAGAASALRETSIIFGAVLARVALKERLSRLRLLGVALTAAGGVLVVVGLGLVKT